jgi:hypothetical protein
VESYRYQVFFDGKRQHRYFWTREEALRFILAMSVKAQENRFEIWEDAGEVILADGRKMGRRFAPSEVWDMRDLALFEKLTAELNGLKAEGG